MSTTIDLQNNSVPSENWDDDFDFQSQSGSPKRQKNVHETPSTMRMSSATEDWDIDNLTSTTSVTNNEPPRQSNVLVDKINITAVNLANWAEEDPSTPQKASFSVEPPTENWDDDFLDKTDSPARRSSRSNNTPSRHSIGGKLRAGVPLNHRKPPRPDDDEEHESWDDEFDFNSSPVKPPKSSTPVKSRRALGRHPGHRASPFSQPNPHYSSDEDDDVDFGGVGAEEDRTVTARSRRTPQPHTPPPPVPTIPFTLTPLTATASTSPNTHLTAPSPRSPTASVFSVPGSSIADTTSLRSTAPLRPSLSRNPASNGLRYVPPSPPLHRERRRLRKKSRPHPQGVMELVDMSHLYPLSDTDVHQRLDEVDERRTPSPPPVSNPISTSVPPTPSQSTNTGGALLSRIGSVKRWSSRRKKGSSTPSDVTKDEKGKDIIRPDGQPAPRPRTSFSSLLHSNQQSAPPPASSNWFFRPTSPVNTRGRKSLGKTSNPRSSFTGSRSGSMTDLSLRGSIYASSSNFEDDDFSGQKSPNKLLKRKSLGFMQLGKGLTSNVPSGSVAGKGGDPPSSPQQKPVSKRPMSMQSQRLPSGARPIVTQRHASYGTTKPTHAADASSDDLPEPIRDRKLSTSRSVRPKAKTVLKEKENEQVKENLKAANKEKDEGSRSFMGSMRRLSLVNRHRRNKSGASLMEAMTRLSSEALSTPLPAPGSPSTSHNPPSLPPLPPMSELLLPRPQTPHTPNPATPALLPPIELQPPSPPRLHDVTSNPVTSNADSLLSPVSVDSSVAPATTSTSAYASTTTLSSSSLSSSPCSPKPQLKTSSSIRSSPPTRNSKTPKTTTSPYTASLGRSTISPKHAITPIEAFPRRNSLSDLKSDLKIPARISQAQQGLKRDLGMVRDFAVYIEQLKKQQQMYHDLVQQMQHKLDIQAQLAQQPAQRTVSPGFFNLTKPKATRGRSNTNPGESPSTRYKELAAAFYTINSKYRISWECAELLVDLADGTSAAVNSSSGAEGPSSSVSAPVGLSVAGGKGRERAITLAGDRSRPSTPTIAGMAITPSSSMPHPSTAGSSPGWRASTGRHDLSHRQLVLLREMLNNAEAVLSADGSAGGGSGNGGVPSVPEEVITASTDDLKVVVNREWRWGNAMSSTVTLPSAELDRTGAESLKKKRRKSRLVGMAGIRDMLRALKKNVSESSSTAVNRDQLLPPVPVNHSHAMLSTASLSTDTSFERSSAGHDHDNSSQPTPTKQKQQEVKQKSSRDPEVVAVPGKERGRDRNPKVTPSSASPYGIQFATKSSPRRPSLASIFRLGRKHTKLSASTTDLPLHGGSDSYHTDISSRPGTSIGNNTSHHKPANAGSPLEEDWDRMDSASDLDVAARALGISAGSKERGSTLKLRKAKSPYLQYQAPSSSAYLPRPSTPRRSASGSQLSLFAESPSKQKARLQLQQQVTPRAPRLSNVNEDGENTKTRDREKREGEGRRSISGTYQKSGSVRSMPPQPISSEPRLAMTPENIKPLLENAKEVHARLGDCIMEIRRLLDADGPVLGDRSVSGSSCASKQSAAS